MRSLNAMHIAAEMTRVLRRNGLILWYDMQTRYPSTSNIQGIGKKPLIDGRAARKPVEIVLGVYQSQRTGQPVVLNQK